MAPVYKATTVFQASTAPEDPRFGVIHTGGWTESFWSQSDPMVAPLAATWDAIQNARALLLPSTAKIIGYRVSKYEMVSNRLTPQGSTAGTLTKPGRDGEQTDIPQMALQWLLSTATPNKAIHTLRCIPDAYVAGGEFKPSPAYLGFTTTYRNLLVGSGFGFAGRDLGQMNARVMGTTTDGSVLLDQIPGTGIAAGDWVRFHRTFNSSFLPVTGAYQVTLVTGNILRLAAFTQIISKPSGTLRKDVIGFFAYNRSNIKRIVSRKVGAPFEKYRGRASKRRR